MHNLSMNALLQMVNNQKLTLEKKQKQTLIMDIVHALLFIESKNIPFTLNSDQIFLDRQLNIKLDLLHPIYFHFKDKKNTPIKNESSQTLATLSHIISQLLPNDQNLLNSLPSFKTCSSFLNLFN